MKRSGVLASALCAGFLALALCACGQSAQSVSDSQTYADEEEEYVEDVEEEPVEEPEEEPEEESSSSSQSVSVKTSTDKYTQYVRNYVGQNAAAFGYSSLGGDRRDRYGGGNIPLVFVTEDGEYFDFTDEEALKDYVVYAQNEAPNTEFKMGFQTDSDGEEYDNLTSWVGLDEIVLNVKKVGAPDGSAKANTAITPGDKYNRYVGDYVGRNLASFGYTSLAGDRRVYVGGGNILLNITAEDGSWVDPNDEEALQDYVVTGQSVSPNTPVTVTFDTDSQGKEYDSLGQTSIESINLTVRRVG